ncbi:glycosyltransferase family 4 protein [Vibrio proteolyticus]
MMSKSKRVGVISYNSVIRDARILKEADSIASNGFDVHIFGLADNNTPSDYEKVRKSGAKITLLEKPEGIQRYDKLVSNSLKIVKRIIQAITYLVYVFLSYLIISNVDAKIIIFGTMISFPILFKKRRAIRNIVTKSVNTLSNKIHSYIKSLTFGYREKVLKKYRQQSLVEAASNFEFDIIHCHDMMTLDVGVEIKKSKGSHLVWDAHEIYEDVAQASDAKKQQYKEILQQNEEYVDSFITINDSIANFYKENYPKLPKANIIKNATVYTGDVTYDGRLHDMAGLTRDQNILLYQGGFAKKRGLDILIESAQYLPDNWTLVMMGWGNYEDHLRKLAGEHTLKSDNRENPRIVFIPPAPHAELSLWTAGAAIGVIPYELFGLNHLYCTPNKLWEYPASGVPILCSGMLEMKYSVEKDDIGWVIPQVFTSTDISDVVNNLKLDTLHQKRSNCLEYIKKDNWSLYEKRLVNVYKEI